MIIFCLCIITLVIVGFKRYIKLLKKYYIDRIQRINSQMEKFKGNYMLMKQWVENHENERNMDLYFKRNNYKKIVVYGLGGVGEVLVKHLLKTEIEVLCIVDKNIKGEFAGIKVENDIHSDIEMDAIIITPFYDYDSIESKINSCTKAPILSIEDYIYQVGEKVL